MQAQVQPPALAFPRQYRGVIRLPVVVQLMVAYAGLLRFINQLLTGRAPVQVCNTHLFLSGARASAQAAPAAIQAALANLPNDSQVTHLYNPAEQPIAAWYPIGPDSYWLRLLGYIECARMPVVGGAVVGEAVVPATHMVHPNMVGAFAEAAADADAPEVRGFVIKYCPVSLAAPTPDEAFLYRACGLRTFHVQARVGGGVHRWVTAETLDNLLADLRASNIAFEQNGQWWVDEVDPENRVVRCRVDALM